MKRIVVLALLLLVAPASAHVGSPNVFFEGEAGPYKVFVTIRTPDVIPGIATIEVRTDADVSQLTVVPMRLTGPGSELPPTPDVAERSPDDRQFFTASLWLMEHGSLQVRIGVDGARGKGQAAVPVPAVAQRTLGMERGLGALLLGLMALLALSMVSIIAGAVREGGLAEGEVPGARARRRARIAIAIAAVVVGGVIWFGNAWWSSEAAVYDQMVARPWKITPRRDGCALTFDGIDRQLLLDHGHEMHLFVVRVPDLDHLAHLHPQRQSNGDLVQQLPSLPAGRYALFADIVTSSGFPVTGTGALELPDLTCGELTGDDSAWSGPSAHMTWDHGVLRAGVAGSLRFRVDTPELEPYMGMAGHAIVVRSDLGVYAHLHPAGSIAMPALDLVRPDPHAGHHMTYPPVVSFPYGFPQPGRYRVFVQVKLEGHVETGVFDTDVER